MCFLWLPRLRSIWHAPSKKKMKSQGGCSREHRRVKEDVGSTSIPMIVAIRIAICLAISMAVIIAILISIIIALILAATINMI